MLRRSAQLVVAASLTLFPALLMGQAAAPPQFFLFCAGQAPAAAPGAMPTMYFSGIMTGPAASLQGFRNGFDNFLVQRFAFRGGVSCSPTTSMVNAQNAMSRETTALRNAKRNVVETGWTESAAAAAAPAPSASPLSNVLGGGRQTIVPSAPVVAPQPAAAPVAAAAAKPAATTNTSGASAGQGTAAGGGGAGNSNNVAGVLGAIFGTNGGSSGGATAAGAAGAKPVQGQAANGHTGTGGTSGGNGAGGANQGAIGQVSSTLTSIFGNKSNAASTGGGTNNARGAQPGAGNPAVANPGAPGQPPVVGTRAVATAQNAAPDGSLGAAQFGTTKLVVYGCGRQDMQVACVTELTNQNAKDTLVQGADVWKDAFIVDDRGDRHARASGFFLNIDGEQRQQLDISNGKSAKFVLMFDNVQTKVQKITLRSQNGGLDVEDINLIAPDASTSATKQ